MSLPSGARYFYRALSDSSSASDLVSGKGRKDRRLSTHELLYEFHNHTAGARRLNDEIYHERLTALVSVTTSFIDVLRRAFNKFYGGDMPEQIWIVFISVPHEDKDIYHHAEYLAQKIKQDRTTVFKNEYIFEWEVPAKYIVHKVSVQTLLDRGLDMKPYCEYSDGRERLPPTFSLRQKVAQHILDPSNRGYDDIGLRLGRMARCFGARAVVCDIAHRILFECIRIIEVDDEAQYVYVSFKPDHKLTLDFEYFYWIDKVIDEVLVDWWLSDLDFYIAYKEHREWVSLLEDEMKRDWETFGENIYYGKTSDPEVYYQTLQAREDHFRAEVEMAAIKLGL